MSQINIVATGGNTFQVSRDDDFLGSFDFGEIDEDGQYDADEDEIIEAARQEFGFGEAENVTVR